MPTLAEVLEKRVNDLSRRIEKLESNGVSPVATEATVVEDNSKYEEVSRNVANLDVKVMQNLDELQDRVNGLEQLKAMTSAVDGLSLHVELLTKHLEGLVQRVEKLEISAESVESA